MVWQFLTASCLKTFGFVNVSKYSRGSNAGLCAQMTRGLLNYSTAISPHVALKSVLELCVDFSMYIIVIYVYNVDNVL